MYNGLFSPPSKGLGSVTNFDEWLMSQQPGVQSKVADAQAANPSDMIPAEGVNPFAPYYGMPSSTGDSPFSKIPTNTLIVLGIGIMVLATALQGGRRR